MKCPPCPDFQWERAPCPVCGAINEEQAGDMCRPSTDETGERECGTDFDPEGHSIKPTAQSIAEMDAWVDVHHNCNGVECEASRDSSSASSTEKA